MFGSLYRKALKNGAATTALDIIKLLAIVNMTTDHIGAYLFPDEVWWRAVGRITVPVWFFLAGYSRSRHFGPNIWIYALLLAVAQPFLGFPIFPLNILVTMIICRYVLNVCEDWGLMDKRLPEVMVAFMLMSVLTVAFFEYGSAAFLFALVGRMIRTGRTKHFMALVLVSYATYTGWQLAYDQYVLIHQVVVVLGTACIVWWLARFDNRVVWQDWRASWWKTAITIVSRNTIPYYFYHRLLLQVAAAWLAGELIF